MSSPPAVGVRLQPAMGEARASGAVHRGLKPRLPQRAGAITSSRIDDPPAAIQDLQTEDREARQHHPEIDGQETEA